jgi:hypothetical protein
MGQFITGVLIENKDGATYEGVTYDRYLKLRLSTEETLSLFDEFMPISTQLSTGVSYEVVLTSLPVPGTVSYAESPSLPAEHDYWQGIVIDLGWLGKKEDYRYVRTYNFGDGERVLLSTVRGNLLMNPKRFKIPIAVGSAIQWKNSRLDLLAVV